MDLGVDNHLVTAVPYDTAIPCGFPTDRRRVHTVRESKKLRQLGVGRGFCGILDKLFEDAHKPLVHDHALWLSSNHAVARYCRQRSIPRIVSPRGMLGSWSLENGKWKKRFAWWLYQKRDLQTATGFHATSQQEAEEIRSLGFQQPIVVAANGLSVPDPLPGRRRDDAKRRALFLSRIHPKKGLLMLVKAWKQASIGNQWELHIAGPDEDNHLVEVQQCIRQEDLESSVRYVGPLDDQAKWQAYVDADLFVLPSFNENFGIVIAEAMAAGLPVITTTSTPWSVLEEKKMGWWIEPNVDALVKSLKSATLLSVDACQQMGQRGKSHVLSELSWRETARLLSDFYIAKASFS